MAGSLEDQNLQVIDEINFIFRTRMLWRDMGSWIRAYIISLYANIGDQDFVSQRLSKVPSEFGDVFRIFFGDENTSSLIGLLEAYISLLQSVFQALNVNNTNAVNVYLNLLYQNTDQIALFLSQINPFWEESKWQNYLRKYTQMVIEEAVTFHEGDYTKNIEIYDNLLSLSLLMGDYISEGLYRYMDQYMDPS